DARRCPRVGQIYGLDIAGTLSESEGYRESGITCDGDNRRVVSGEIDNRLPIRCIMVASASGDRVAQVRPRYEGRIDAVELCRRAGSKDDRSGDSYCGGSIGGYPARLDLP